MPSTGRVWHGCVTTRHQTPLPVCTCIVCTWIFPCMERMCVIGSYLYCDPLAAESSESDSATTVGRSAARTALPRNVSILRCYLLDAVHAGFYAGTSSIMPSMSAVPPCIRCPSTWMTCCTGWTLQRSGKRHLECGGAGWRAAGKTGAAADLPHLARKTVLPL